MKEAVLYQSLEGGRVKCTACARYCNMPEGKVGYCGVRQNIGGKLQLLVYGKVITGQIDPIEKKPVVHYNPGSKIFSIATTGCSWGCTYCFTPETIVFTDQGMRTFADLFDEGRNETASGLKAERKVPGYAALTHRGRFRRIKQVFRHFYDGPILSIRPIYLPGIRCTPEHKVLATSSADTKPSMIEARYLTRKNYVAIPKIQVQIPSPTIDLAVFLGNEHPGNNEVARAPALCRMNRSSSEKITSLTTRSHTTPTIGRMIRMNPSSLRSARSKILHWGIDRLTSGHRRPEINPSNDSLRLTKNERNIPRFLEVGPDLARLLGYFAAHGSVSKNRDRPLSFQVAFTFRKDDQGNIDDVIHLVKKLFGLDCGQSTVGPVAHVIVPGSILGLFFLRECEKDCYTRKVPEIILADSRERVARAFLEGYLRGTGYTTTADKPETSFLGANRVSQELILGLSLLFLKVGAVPRLYARENSPTTVIEGRRVGGHSDGILKVLEKYGSGSAAEALEWEDIHSSVVETTEYYLVPIRSTKTEHYSGFVYNMEVEDDHTYIANLQAVSNCQNNEISQRRKPEGIEIEPLGVVEMAVEHGCEGLAYTYNQPTIFIEYARDVGIEAHKKGLTNIFVSNGYDTPDAVGMMNNFLDCITVDFKGNAETGFLRKHVMVPDAQPIFQTLLDIRDKTKIHTEITDLVIPEIGDSLEEAGKLCTWLYDNLGPDVPIHFLRFHPDYKLMHLPLTPVKTLEEHCKVARSVGLRYVYVGNVPGHPWEHTYCPGCRCVAVKRYGYNILEWNLDDQNRCVKCGYRLPIVGRLSKSYNRERFLPVLN